MDTKLRITPYLITMPACFVGIGFIIYPIIEIIRTSFTSWNFLRPDTERFVGFATYLDVFTDPVFGQVMVNTMLWMVLGTGLCLVIGTAIGYFLSFDFGINRILRAAIIVPWVLPPVVTAAIWSWMLNSKFGVINDMLVRMGILKEGFAFLANGHTAFLSLVMILVWKNVPIVALLLSAGFQGVPLEMTEAARMDGANALQRFWKIIFPSIRQTFLAVAIIVNIWAMQQFVLIWQTTQGGPVNSTHILPTYIFQMFTQSFNYGKVGVLSVVNITVLLVIALIYVRVLRNED